MSAALRALATAAARWPVAIGFACLVGLASPALAQSAPPLPAEPLPAASAAAPAPASAASLPSAAMPAAPSHSAESVQIADAYIELHTGPGRGFPVFFVAARGQWIEIQLRHTDWFKVRTEEGKVGWVTRQQLETTLTAAGEQKSFKDTVLDDYLHRKLQLGAAWGHFKAEPMLKVWSSYRLSETLSVEGTIGQVQGVFSGTDFWHLNLLAEPWSDRRFSPFFTVGVGRFSNFPNLSLIGATTTNAKLANAGVGARFYITERFVARADYTLYTAFLSDAKTTQYQAWTLGLSFFF